MANTWTSVAGIPSGLTPDTMMLLTDGSLFVHSSGGKDFYRLAPDANGRYESGVWTGPFSMANTRQFFASGVLKDGRVFAIGGEYSDAGNATPLGEIFDPTTGTWSPINKPSPSFDFINSDAVSCILADGRVLFGAPGGPQTALWDPVLDLWTQAGRAFGTSATDTKIGGTNEETWCLLPEGTVLSVEVFNGSNTMKYVPELDQWIGCGNTPGRLPLASLVDPTSGATVGISEIGPGLTLPDGRAFFVGGTGRTALYTMGASSTQPGSWIAGPNLPTDTSTSTFNQVNGNLQTAIDAPGTLLPNGQVLFVAGNTVRQTPSSGVQFWSKPSVLYLFDPAANTIAALNPQPASTTGETWKTRLLTLPTGQVAYTAQASNVMQILTVDAATAAPQAAWKPVLTGSPATVQPGRVYTISGTQFNGLSQTSSYGDDAGVATNFPLARFKKRGSNKVAYARTFAFSSLGIATASAPQTASMAVPGDLAPGQYDLVVVANGIASDPVGVHVSQQDCFFVIARNTFSEGEVTSLINLYGSPAKFDPALYVVVEGYTPAELGLTSGNLASPPHKPSIPTVNGISFRFTGSVIPQDPALPARPQRFTFPFTTEFADASAFGFAATTLDVGITASMTAAGSTVSSAAVLQLIRNPNPYILHGDTAHGGDWYLSVDLRVFQATAGTSRFGAHVATAGTARTAATQFIQQVITNFNASTASASGIFDGLQSDEDLSALTLAPTDTNGRAVYNFVLARVRYRDTIPANKVRVFFRMWPAQQTNAVYDTNTLYRTSPPNATGERIALLGRQGDEIMTIPFFATPRIDTGTTNMRNQTDAPNVRNIPPDALGGEVTAYFGAWLDINQPNDLVLPARLTGPVAANLPDGPFTGMGTLLPIQRLVRSAHQCIIAEIAFDPVPVRAGTDPSTSDKLAQRNLTFVNVPNPGLPGSRWAPQTFEVRPTPLAFPAEFPPDELMLEWGDIPAGTTASIYLPSPAADDILALADQLYDTHTLTKVDDHTIGCPSGGVTYLPIPRGADPNFAGLLTVELPAGIHKGDVHDLVVRQLTLGLSRVGGTGREVRELERGMAVSHLAEPLAEPEFENADGDEVAAPTMVVAAEGFRSDAKTLLVWRRVLGMFKVVIPVSTKGALLEPETRLLSVLRWILDAVPLGSRWHPVLVRYVDQQAARVRDLGGDPDAVPADPNGDWDGSIRDASDADSRDGHGDRCRCGCGRCQRSGCGCGCGCGGSAETKRRDDRARQARRRHEEVEDARLADAARLVEALESVLAALRRDQDEAEEP